MQKIRGDFNGLWSTPDGSTLLCLSHSETALDQHGNRVRLETAMEIISYDEDVDAEGNRDDLIAKGTVEPAPDWLQCKGSKWVLRIDGDGVRNESEIAA